MGSDRARGGASCEKGSTLPGVWEVVYDCLNKGVGMPSHVYATGYVKYPVPLVKKSRASCRGGRFPLSYIQQVVSMTSRTE